MNTSNKELVEKGSSSPAPAPAAAVTYTVVFMGADGKETGRLDAESVKAARRTAKQWMRPFWARGMLVFAGTASNPLGRLLWEYVCAGYLPPRLDGKPHEPEFLRRHAPKYSGWIRRG